MADLDDLTFLAELIRQRDTNPSNDTSGVDIATALGHPDADTEPIVRRLMARGYVDKSARPGRLSDGVADWDLIVTPTGYAKLEG